MVPRDLNIGNSTVWRRENQGQIYHLVYLLIRYFGAQSGEFAHDGISLCKQINAPWSFVYAWKILAARFLAFHERKLDILE